MRKLNTISVGELKNILDNYDDDTPVAFTCSYGDRCRTQQVIGLLGRDEMEALYETAYSESGFAISDRYDDGDDDGEPQEVLIIR